MTSHPHSPRRAAGVALALSGACLWGTTGTSQALLVGEHSPVAVGGLRALVAAIALLALALLRGPVRWLRTLRTARPAWLMAAGLSVAAYQLTFFAAVDRTGVAVGTLVMLATAPGVAGLVGWLLHGLRPSRLWAVATLVGLAGAALLVLGSGGSRRLDWWGLALAVAAGAAFALYSVAGRELSGSGADQVSLTSGIFAVASLVLAVPLLRQDLAFVSEPRNLLVLGWLGVVATAVAYLLYQQGLRSIDAATASTVALAEPMVANLLAVLVLHEPFTVVMGLGVLLVLAGLGLLSRA
ncbi:DMT family transporter [Luteococcus peritonei]|uniref:DMT family transporter n=1 Tax=Luteococcus peritonei TaxID=88874 RepID=A0ABW4RXH2_9ACTN